MKELKDSEERLYLLSNNLPDSALYQYVQELDGSVRFLYCSAGIEKLNSVSIQDVLHDPATLHRQLPPEYFEQLVENEARSARELSNFDMDVPMQLPNGQLRWMRLHSRPRLLQMAERFGMACKWILPSVRRLNPLCAKAKNVSVLWRIDPTIGLDSQIKWL